MLNAANSSLPAGLPQARGLYDPSREHDACGVGMICRLDGQKSRAIVSDGLAILRNLMHRGAYGCDAKTGDGAGIMIQMPHDFLEQVISGEGIRLPPEGEYACGPIFLPKDKDQRQWLMEMAEATVRQEGQQMLGWRRVPTANEVLGHIARAKEPEIHQLFIGRGADVGDPGDFERKLYVIRKVMERCARQSGLSQRGVFHVPSLSSRTLIYKGMFQADQIAPYYPDLSHPAMQSALALVHQRYSTNTFPTWELAHPFRFLCHNGEINTLRGNVNWLNARQHLFQSKLFGEDIHKLLPIATPGGSDSAIFDNALELLYHTGRSLAHSMMMMIPEAWQAHQTMDDERRAFYEYHACLMEPWDGPASIAFSDGIQVGAVLDRNGLRPSRYTVTKDGRVIMGSETGVLDLAPEMIQAKGRLQPGRMFLIDLSQHRIIADEEIKATLSRRKPYRAWLAQNLVRLCDLPPAGSSPGMTRQEINHRQLLFGYTLEDFKFIIRPMAKAAEEPVGSMGEDTPPAILSDHPRPLFDYFHQLFAQVTNPPLDAIREALVTSLSTTLGPEADLFFETPLHCRQLQIDHPILTDSQLERIRNNHAADLTAVTLPICYPVKEGAGGLKDALDALFDSAANAVEKGAAILILSDRDVSPELAPIPSLLATAGVHHHLIGKGLRTLCGIVVETGEAREIHHFCCLIGYGAGAVNPYLCLAGIEEMAHGGKLTDISAEKATANFIKAAGKGILKVMSKMGISTLQSYRGAQIFEAIGLSEKLIEAYFCGTRSAIGGSGLERIAAQIGNRHDQAYGSHSLAAGSRLPAGGKYQWRRGGETHQYDPLSIARLHQAVRNNDRAAWRQFTEIIDSRNRQGGLIRGLLELRAIGPPVDLDEVEPVAEIFKRFKTGGMSYGSISREAHETLAIAMNRIGGKSNSGEGGEDARRFTADINGDLRNSAIKQVASGRFGVTSHYLVNAKELQIKMAQGAKPGEGGQLPGFKVYPEIARTRHSTPYVGLISPPPHHDIYSIEDLAQLIFDLKNANANARVSVKLVSEVGVGTIAAGVVKGKADVVLISGNAGGTGASPQGSIKYGGIPWELGLSETQQTLLLNGLRDKIVVECDGQLKTARDVAVAALLGAQEFGFGTIALVALGCVMMRVCHLNTCPVGIATQDPRLRKKFTGRPEHLVNFMRFVAEDLREIMAGLGFRNFSEMIGKVECLDVEPALDHWRKRGLDLSRILHAPAAPSAISAYCQGPAATGLGRITDHELIEKVKAALLHRQPVALDISIRNTQRTLGTLLSSEISKRFGEAGLPEDTIVFRCTGSAGQSFCAFGAPGLSFHIMGEANDYFGKGLSGAKLSIRPPVGATFLPQENIIIGNAAFYGATAGKAYISGVAGERFCVRNSGVIAVVEGVGDHGCEYMTGGMVVVLGATGRNFAAGMSGGIAFVFDADGRFATQQCNREMVELLPVRQAEDKEDLKRLLTAHRYYTQSPLAGQLLDRWPTSLSHFIKVLPGDYKLALERLAKEKTTG
jgi:glutamate synthase domain-containing protein 2/glutamate synthase domain-containing protein 1/glutamate synthase domain-containing protein 3